MTSGFTGKNCCAVVATGIVLGLMIAASVGSWYTNQIEYQRELSANVGSGDANSG
eukprot:CAMPEP_0175879658 /NCGR_PEP_ID=MMETSP0107_2-20121207/41884_1 /TAXON_ID=195067 ORGANISM="Goniomonas pacifica, Strain CCMP1869" /NCGR_SAMPLE_ID=MMETSP0107_2 /ASSEMBLY_ACC=CAM_ASM_000203 /LENGTH=54 /DNA_ID=CAMNT_0017199315 /DNA_START=40 /DNA_END=201 /DNA_ORIENTATION=+